MPPVIGLKIATARAALRAAGLHPVSLNVACNRGTLASQSVVTSLSVAGEAPTPTVGAVPLEPWSHGCARDAGRDHLVGVLRQRIARARHRRPHPPGGAPRAHRGGARVGLLLGGPADDRPRRRPPTTTDQSVGHLHQRSRGHDHDGQGRPQTVLTQSPAPGTVLKPGSIVSFTMHACPQ